MKYKDLYTIFKKEFEEDDVFFKMLEKENRLEPNDSELVHVYFCLVVCPYVYKLIEEHNDSQLKKVFNFFERMANDSDEDTQGVLQCSVLENITTESKDIYKTAQKYIGPKTKEFVNQVATYMAIDRME